MLIFNNVMKYILRAVWVIMVSWDSFAFFVLREHNCVWRLINCLVINNMAISYTQDPGDDSGIEQDSFNDSNTSKRRATDSSSDTTHTSVITGVPASLPVVSVIDIMAQRKAKLYEKQLFIGNAAPAILAKPEEKVNMNIIWLFFCNIFQLEYVNVANITFSYLYLVRIVNSWECVLCSCRQMKLLTRMVSLLYEGDADVALTVRKMAALSLLKIFTAVLPAYRLGTMDKPGQICELVLPANRLGTLDKPGQRCKLVLQVYRFWQM